MVVEKEVQVHYAKYPKRWDVYTIPFIFIHPTYISIYILREYIHIKRCYGPTEAWEKGIGDLEDVSLTLNILKGRLSCSICGQVLSSEQSFCS